MSDANDGEAQPKEPEVEEYSKKKNYNLLLPNCRYRHFSCCCSLNLSY